MKEKRGIGKWEEGWGNEACRGRSTPPGKIIKPQQLTSVNNQADHV